MSWPVKSSNDSVDRNSDTKHQVSPWMWWFLFYAIQRWFLQCWLHPSPSLYNVLGLTKDGWLTGGQGRMRGTPPLPCVFAWRFLHTDCRHLRFISWSPVLPCEWVKWSPTVHPWTYSIGALTRRGVTGLNCSLFHVSTESRRGPSLAPGLCSRWNIPCLNCLGCFGLQLYFWLNSTYMNLNCIGDKTWV